MEYVLSLSYGKDSLACLGAIEKLGWSLDRIVHAEVWATDSIPADLPPMVEFKAKADEIIKSRWGITVEHIRSNLTFEAGFYTPVSRGKVEFQGNFRGWPLLRGSWCLRDLKIPVMKPQKDVTYYTGIAFDEKDRFNQLSDTLKSPLVEIGWEEDFCGLWCKYSGLLSPIYSFSCRGGCFFCPKQPIDQLRSLRKNYPNLWSVMLGWDCDSLVPFRADGHTLLDFDRRFQLEDKGCLVPGDRSFRWKMLCSDMGVS